MPSSFHPSATAHALRESFRGKSVGERTAKSAEPAADTDLRADRNLLVLAPAHHHENDVVLRLRDHGWSLTRTSTLAETRTLLGVAPPTIALVAGELPDETVREFTALAAGRFPVVLWSDGGAAVEERAQALGADACWSRREIPADALAPLLLQVRKHWLALDRHRAAEQQLRDERSRLTTIIEASRLGTWEWHIDTGRILVNAGWAEMLGYTLEELAPISIATWRQLAHPDDLARSDEAIRCYFRGELPDYECDSRMRHKDGRWIWVNDRGRIAARGPDGAPRLMCGTHTDITARKAAEDFLQVSAAQLRLQTNALNAAANGIVITDRDARIEWANTAFARMSGYSLEEVIGRNPSELVRSDQHDTTFYSAMWATILAGEVWHGEVVNRRKDGQLYTEEMTITPVRDSGGEITRFIAVKQDITQRKALAEQVRQAQKMEAIGQLAGGVAHDFNNILSAVLVSLGLIRQNPALDAASQEHIKNLTLEIQRGASLSRQLLAFSRQQAMDLRRLQLNEVVAGLLKMLGRLLGETIRVNCDHAPALPAVEADVGMMEQVILNLCLNARDAMPGGGSLTLALDEVEVTPALATENPAARPGRFVRLRVIDTGHGMTPEVLGKLFQPFFTTKAAGQGTGLGLATVYGIVQQHHGWLQVESRPGLGSTFHVYLPASAASPESVEPAKSGPPDRGRGETILFVEDELALRITAALTLRQYGYEVLEACDGPAALRLWQEHRESIGLLLTDLVLPNGVNGFDLIARLHAEKPGLRTIASTGYSRREVDLPPGSDRSLPIIRKPYDRDQLLAEVRRVLDRT